MLHRHASQHPLPEEEKAQHTQQEHVEHIAAQHPARRQVNDVLPDGVDGRQEFGQRGRRGHQQGAR